VVPSNKGRTGVAFKVRLQSWGLAIASWIEAGGFARSYQEFNWLVDKGGQREQEAEVNSGVLEIRFPGVTSGAGEHCKVFDDNTNQYLIDQRILVGGMLCFEVTPISSSQARVVHGGTDLCIKAPDCTRRCGLCKRAQRFVCGDTEMCTGARREFVQRCQRSGDDQSFCSFRKDRLRG